MAEKYMKCVNYIQIGNAPPVSQEEIGKEKFAELVGLAFIRGMENIGFRLVRENNK